jgi:glycosyltransferase involved in cell wall biosynthesis
MAMTENPKVSVCVVTYNQKNYIRECLQSIVDQKADFEYEVIVGDDGSTDGTTEIVQEFAERYPTRVIPVCHEKNLGACANYFSVHRLASGDLIASCDGDDYWLPGKIQAQVDFMMQHPECNISGHKAYRQHNTGKLYANDPDDMPPITTVSAFYRYGNFLIHSSTMYRSTRQLDVGMQAENGFDFLFHIWRAGDGAIGFINKYFAVYRQHDASMMAQYYKSLVYFKMNLVALEEIHKVVRKPHEFQQSKFRLCKEYMKNFIVSGRTDLAQEIATTADRFISKRTHLFFLNLMVSMDYLVVFAVCAVRAKRKFLKRNVIA